MAPQEQVYQSTAPGDDLLLHHRTGKNEEDDMIPTRSTMERLDPYEPVERRSVFHRESFLMQFASQEGPRSVLLLMVCLAMGLGSTIGVVPAVMTDRYARLVHGYDDERNCADYAMGLKPPACLQGSADAQNASAMANLVNNIITFVTSSLMGALSDEYGRRALLVMGVFLSTLGPLMLVLIQIFPQMSPTCYYAAGSLTGFISWTAVALSSLSDVMPPQWRAASFGMLLAGLFMGFAAAPSLALLFSHFQVSLLAYGVIGLAFFHALLFFPETLSPDRAAVAQGLQRARVAGMTARERIGWNLLRPARELSILNRSDFFRLLSACAFFSGMVSAGDQTLLIYYVEERLAFNDKDIATMFLIMGILGLLSQAVVLKPLIECLGERMVVTLCFLVGAVDNFMYGVAKHKLTVFVAMALGSFKNMAFPTISAIKSNNVNESEQGRIQGALYSLQALASGLGPVVMRYVYHLTADGAFLGPGSMFVVASFLLLIAAGCAFALPKSKADSRPSSRARRNDSLYDDTTETEAGESSAFVADASTPMLRGSGGGAQESSSGSSYGSDDANQRDTELSHTQS